MRYPEFLARGLELSPLTLPLRADVIGHADRAFGSLPGLFDDSLPDGWGLLLMDPTTVAGEGARPDVNELANDVTRD